MKRRLSAEVAHEKHKRVSLTIRTTRMSTPVNETNMTSYNGTEQDFLGSDYYWFQSVYLGYLWTALAIGLPGNILIAVVYMTVQQKRTSDWFIFFLSIYDCAVCVFAIPLYLSIETGAWMATGSDLACKIEQFIISTAQVSSVSILGIIAVDRYLKICLPTKKSLHANQARNIGICTPLFSAIVAAPALVWDGNVEHKFCRLQDQYKNTLGVKIHRCFIFGFFVCMFTVVIFCYTHVSIVVKRRVQRHKENALKRKHLMQIPAFLQAISNVDGDLGNTSRRGARRGSRKFSLFSLGSSRRLSAISPWIKARLSLPSDNNKAARLDQRIEPESKESLAESKKKLDKLLQRKSKSMEIPSIDNIHSCSQSGVLEPLKQKSSHNKYRLFKQKSEINTGTLKKSFDQNNCPQRDCDSKLKLLVPADMVTGVLQEGCIHEDSVGGRKLLSKPLQQHKKQQDLTPFVELYKEDGALKNKYFKPSSSYAQQSASLPRLPISNRTDRGDISRQKEQTLKTTVHIQCDNVNSSGALISNPYYQKIFIESKNDALLREENENGSSKDALGKTCAVRKQLTNTAQKCHPPKSAKDKITTLYTSQQTRDFRRNSEDVYTRAHSRDASCTNDTRLKPFQSFVHLQNIHQKLSPNRVPESRYDQKMTKSDLDLLNIFNQIPEEPDIESLRSEHTQKVETIHLSTDGVIDSPDHYLDISPQSTYKFSPCCLSSCCNQPQGKRFQESVIDKNPSKDHPCNITLFNSHKTCESSLKGNYAKVRGDEQEDDNMSVWVERGSRFLQDKKKCLSNLSIFKSLKGEFPKLRNEKRKIVKDEECVTESLLGKGDPSHFGIERSRKCSTENLGLANPDYTNDVLDAKPSVKQEGYKKKKLSHQEAFDYSQVSDTVMKKENETDSKRYHEDAQISSGRVCMNILNGGKQVADDELNKYRMRINDDNESNELTVASNEGMLVDHEPYDKVISDTGTNAGVNISQLTSIEFPPSCPPQPNAIGDKTFRPHSTTESSALWGNFDASETQMTDTASNQSSPLSALQMNFNEQIRVVSDNEKTLSYNKYYFLKAKSTPDLSSLLVHSHLQNKKTWSRETNDTHCKLKYLRNINSQAKLSPIPVHLSSQETNIGTKEDNDKVKTIKRSGRHTCPMLCFKSFNVNDKLKEKSCAYSNQNYFSFSEPHVCQKISKKKCNLNMIQSCSNLSTLVIDCPLKTTKHDPFSSVSSDIIQIVSANVPSADPFMTSGVQSDLPPLYPRTASASMIDGGVHALGINQPAVNLMTVTSLAAQPKAKTLRDASVNLFCSERCGCRIPKKVMKFSSDNCTFDRLPQESERNYTDLNLTSPINDNGTLFSYEPCRNGRTEEKLFDNSQNITTHFQLRKEKLKTHLLSKDNVCCKTFKEKAITSDKCNDVFLTFKTFHFIPDNMSCDLCMMSRFQALGCKSTSTHYARTLALQRLVSFQKEIISLQPIPTFLLKSDIETNTSMFQKITSLLFQSTDQYSDNITSNNSFIYEICEENPNRSLPKFDSLPLPVQQYITVSPQCKQKSYLLDTKAIEVTSFNKRQTSPTCTGNLTCCKESFCIIPNLKNILFTQSTNPNSNIQHSPMKELFPFDDNFSYFHVASCTSQNFFNTKKKTPSLVKTYSDKHIIDKHEIEVSNHMDISKAEKDRITGHSFNFNTSSLQPFIQTFHNYYESSLISSNNLSGQAGVRDLLPIKVQDINLNDACDSSALSVQIPQTEPYSTTLKSNTFGQNLHMNKDIVIVAEIISYICLQCFTVSRYIISSKGYQSSQLHISTLFATPPTQIENSPHRSSSLHTQESLFKDCSDGRVELTADPPTATMCPDTRQQKFCFIHNTQCSGHHRPDDQSVYSEIPVRVNVPMLQGQGRGCVVLETCPTGTPIRRHSAESVKVPRENCTFSRHHRADHSPLSIGCKDKMETSDWLRHNNKQVVKCRSSATEKEKTAPLGDQHNKSIHSVPAITWTIDTVNSDSTKSGKSIDPHLGQDGCRKRNQDNDRCEVLLSISDEDISGQGSEDNRGKRGIKSAHTFWAPESQHLPGCLSLSGSIELHRTPDKEISNQEPILSNRKEVESSDGFTTRSLMDGTHRTLIPLAIHCVNKLPSITSELGNPALDVTSPLRTVDYLGTPGALMSCAPSSPQTHTTTGAIHATLLGCLPTYGLNKNGRGEQCGPSRTYEFFVRSVFDAFFDSSGICSSSEPCLANVPAEGEEVYEFPLFPLSSGNIPSDASDHERFIYNRSSTLIKSGSRSPNRSCSRGSGMSHSWYSLNDLDPVPRPTTMRKSRFMYLTALRRQLNQVFSPRGIRQFFGISGDKSSVKRPGNKGPAARDHLSTNHINVIITRCESLVMDRHLDEELPPMRGRAATLDPAYMDKGGTRGSTESLFNTSTGSCVEQVIPFKPRASSLDTTHSSPDDQSRSPDTSIDRSRGCSLDLLSPASASIMTGSMCSGMSSISRLTECSAYTETSRSDCEKITRRTAEREHNITRLLGVITFIFVISWSVSWVVILHTTWSPVPLPDSSHVTLSLPRDLFLVNHFCNIIVYVMLSKSFRDKLAQCYNNIKF